MVMQFMIAPLDVVGDPPCSIVLTDRNSAFTICLSRTLVGLACGAAIRLDGRAACVLRQLRQGSSPGWPEQVERLDQLKDEIPRKAERWWRRRCIR